jgi:hypothetical protein
MSVLRSCPSHPSAVTRHASASLTKCAVGFDPFSCTTLYCLDLLVRAMGRPTQGPSLPDYNTYVSSFSSSLPPPFLTVSPCRQLSALNVYDYSSAFPYFNIADMHSTMIAISFHPSTFVSLSPLSSFFSYWSQLQRPSTCTISCSSEILPVCLAHPSCAITH